MERYEGTFGKRNYNFTIGKVDFVAIDAQTIDGKVNIIYHSIWLQRDSIWF